MIITRIGYCQFCANSRNPRTGQQFLAFGSSHNAYKVLDASHNGHIGYVPFIYKGKVNGNNVIVEKSCAMFTCGVDRIWKIDKNSKYYYYFIKEFTREIWTLETWNALVQLKHNTFTKDYEI